MKNRKMDRPKSRFKNGTSILQINTLHIKAFALFFVWLIIAPGLHAQQTFKYQATLPPVTADGFYSINIQPIVLAKSKANTADLRITDQDNKFVAYIFSDQLPLTGKNEFVIFPKSKESVETDTSSVYVVENNGNYSIDKLTINMRRADVTRTIDLSGSDDLKHWYAIKENLFIEDAQSASTTTFSAIITFPLSNYRYFKLQMGHKNKQPLAILNVGINRQQLVNQNYVQIPIAAFTQKDTANISRLTIQFSEQYLIGKLKFDIGGSKYYKRPIYVYQRQGSERVLINSSQLSSAEQPSVYFDGKTNKLEVEIENNDNPPLVIKQVTAWHLPVSIISYLEKDKQYKLLFGDPKATAPSYDLRFFTDSLIKQLPAMSPGAITSNPLYQEKAAVKPKDYTLIMWAAIAAVIAVLGMLTLKMMKEVKSRADK